MLSMLSTKYVKLTNSKKQFVQRFLQREVNQHLIASGESLFLLIFSFKNQPWTLFRFSYMIYHIWYMMVYNPSSLMLTTRFPVNKETLSPNLGGFKCTSCLILLQLASHYMVDGNKPHLKGLVTPRPHVKYFLNVRFILYWNSLYIYTHIRYSFWVRTVDCTKWPERVTQVETKRRNDK